MSSLVLVVKSLGPAKFRPDGLAQTNLTRKPPGQGGRGESFQQQLSSAPVIVTGVSESFTCPFSS